jgi:hypothetical protein
MLGELLFGILMAAETRRKREGVYRQLLGEYLDVDFELRELDLEEHEDHQKIGPGILTAC